MSYGLEQFTMLDTGGEARVFRAKNDSGEGTITEYDVFPGVTLSYNDFHMRYFESRFVPRREMLCIDHCREGRLEYAARQDAYSYVEAGDLKLDRRLSHTGRFDMPLSHYHGLTISIDMAEASAALPIEVKDFPVRLQTLQQKYCPSDYPMVLRALPSVEHICAELYAVPQEIRKPYFKIKILELLLFLQALELPKEVAERPYFYKTQVEKVKAVQRHLAEHLDESFTQEELSECFDIPLTAMKRCFKSVFGASIGSWLTEYRMNYAAELLRQDRERSVAEIAGMVGYDSPSKFAIVFRKVMDMSPVEYRKK